MFNTISSIALLLISGGVAFMYITPKYTDIMNLRNNNSELSAALVKAEDITNTSNDLSKKMRELPSDGLDRLERLLPLKFDELRFVNNLQGIGERNGLNIKGITMAAAQANASGGQPQGVPDGGMAANKGYVTHKFSFNVLAPYGTFIVFLKDLERSLEFADINSVSLATSGALGQSGKQASQDAYNYQIELTTYSLK